MSNQGCERMSKGQSQMGTQSGRRTLERCKFKGKTKNVVYVDVENGRTHDVILIDAPEVSQSPKKLQNGNYVNIDDDDIHVEESDDCDTGGSAQDCSGTSSKAFSPAFSQKQRSNFDEFHFRSGKCPMKFSKSRRTYSEKTFSRNRFGLSPSSDSSSSESDDSDCELMEGSSGKIREQWERAASKKRKCEGFPNGHPDLGEASGSGSSKGTPENIEVENTTQEHVDGTSCSNANDTNIEKMNMSTSTANGDGATGNTSVTLEEGVRVFEADLSGHPSLDEATGSGFFMDTPNKVDVESTTKQHEEVSSHSRSNDTKDEMDDHIRDSFLTSEEALFPKCSKTVDQESACSRTPLSKLAEEYIHQNGHLVSEIVNHKSASHQDNEKPASDNRAPDFRENKTHVDILEPSLGFNNDIRRKDERHPLHERDGSCALDAENNIIGEKEKYKETDEYKRADEEEWASRHRQLQLQAEEVQKLRKRKKAEAQRQIDMERRQKERVEEMRETQKKNVETINLKEQLRAEVRKELQRLEAIHTDMASLLRALGISLGGHPTSQEVNAAYKQALLRFHPDRASKTDIRQQVEAEEKFKLVSRVRGKLTNVTSTR